MFAVASINGLSPMTLLGYGHGAFNNVVQSFEITGNSSAVGDFNGDGKLDVTIDGTSILLGNGDGTFTQAASVCDYRGNTVAILLGNGDGKLDLAVVNSNAVSIPPQQ